MNTLLLKEITPRNMLLRKEIRMLLPAWIGALVAATMPLWVGHYYWDTLPLLMSVPVLALALSPFGLETSYGTFGLMLVQPEERRRFWRIKTRLLAVALVTTWAVFVFCVLAAPNPTNINWTALDAFPQFLKISALVMLLAFSGGLWTTLLLRDMVASFFCTWLIPTILSGVTFAVVSHWVTDDKRGATILYWVLLVYGVAGFLWARRLFLGAQDVPWTGGSISLTSVRGMSLRWLAFEFKGRQNPYTTLVKKELQMQEITMFLVPILALLHLAVLTAYHFAPQRMSKELVYNSIPIIWLVTVPFVIGCVTVAEERRLNTLEGLLCLPLTKREQFAVKFVVALFLGVALGGIIPGILFHMGGEMPKDFTWQYPVEIAAAITAISFYASTMSRGLLQALPTAVCVPTVASMIIALVDKLILFLGGNLEFATTGYLFPTLVLPAMSVTLIWLSFRNYKRLQTGWRIWLGDTVRAGAVFGCATLATLTIFDRSWELFLPLEPTHGAARISGTGRASMVVSRPDVITRQGFAQGQRRLADRFRLASDLDVLLPDGRLWIGEMTFDQDPVNSVSGSFANGSNWVEIAAYDNGAIGLQSDGTLWRILNSSNITQIGSDSDWKQIAGGEGTFRAVKQDGTLWESFSMAKITNGHKTSSVTNNSNIITYEFKMRSGPTRPFINNSDLTRIGDESDWANVFIVSDEQFICVRSDGSTWKRMSVHWDMEGTNWLSMASAWSLGLGIRADGSLWAAGYLPEKFFSEYASPGFHLEPVRIGSKSDWVAVSGNWQQTALEANGTLWTMDFGRYYRAKRPSKYADWLAATQQGQFTWALAKDGTLSCWDEFTVRAPYSGILNGVRQYPTFMEIFCLGPSRRPIVSINILDKRL